MKLQKEESNMRKEQMIAQMKQEQVNYREELRKKLSEEEQNEKQEEMKYRERVKVIAAENYQKIKKYQRLDSPKETSSSLKMVSLTLPS